MTKKYDDEEIKKATKKFQDKINNIHNFPGVAPVEIEIEKLSEVQEVMIDWLWKDVIAYGKITLFAGEPGVGKSQLLLYIASIISNGGVLQGQTKNCEQNKVLLISGEDKSDDTLKPRLMALGANLDNIHNVKGIKKLDKNGHLYYDAICLVENMADLEEKIREENYRLIIVDPVSVYLNTVDQDKNKEIRSAMGILTALAERHRIGMVLNSHFNKPSGSVTKNAIYRVMGSIGFAAAARIIYGIMKDPEDPSRRLFLPIKNNIGQDTTGYAYKIKSILINNCIETSRIDWLDEKINQTANEILNNPSEKQTPKLDEAIEFLKDILKHGTVSLTEIRKKAEDKKISISRLYAAKKELKIEESDSFGGKRGIIWMLS